MQSAWPDGVAGLERHQFACAFADGLDHQGDDAGHRVGPGNGQRNAFGAFREMDDDELSRLADLGDARGADVKPGDVGAELLPG